MDADPAAQQQQQQQQHDSSSGRSSDSSGAQATTKQEQDEFTTRGEQALPHTQEELLPPQQLASTMKLEIARLSKVIKAASIRPD